MKNKKVLLLLVLLVVFLIPKNVSATTLKQYEDAVAKYTKELKEKQAKIATNEKEIAKIRQNIASIEGQIKSAEQEIIALQEEIDRSNEEIKQKSEESKSLMAYFQLTNGDNAYLEYAFGSETITDMIYRISIVEQMTEHNDQVMHELENLIESNKQKTKELDNKKKELASLKEKLEDQKERIEEDTDSIRDTVPSVKQQIAAYEQQVKYWKSKGCKSNDVLGVTCAVPPKVIGGGGAGSIIGANGFRIPIEYGYVTQGFQGKWGHFGIDFGSSNKSIPIYPIANGQVIYVGVDRYGGNVVKIVHNVNGKLLFSTYVHMRTVYFKKGQVVGPMDKLGLMGSTGNSTGPHLHLEMTTCDWTYNCTYDQYKNSLVNPWNYIPSW